MIPTNSVHAVTISREVLWVGLPNLIKAKKFIPHNPSEIKSSAAKQAAAFANPVFFAR